MSIISFSSPQSVAQIPSRSFGCCGFPGVLQRTACLIMVILWTKPLIAQSVYTAAPEDPRAVYFTKNAFQTHADGIEDDSEALRTAVNRVRQGVVFIPEGRYRIAKTVYIPPGVRLIGYGKERPVFVLAPNTPGFQQGARRYMFWFIDSRQADGTVVDASEFTMYSAMSNIDFDVREGNPAAVAIRFHVAQHCFLSHMDFHLGTARAALEDIGNQASDIHVYGGQYGIITKKTSPNWQFLLMDSTFENQSVAGIRTQEVGFTLIRCNFSHMPVAIEIPEGEVEQLYSRDLRMEDIKVAAVKFGDTRNVRHEVTLANTACADVPHFLAGGEAIDAPSRFYIVDRLSSGLEIGGDGREVGIVTRHKETPLQQAAPIVPSDIPPLPPVEQWVNVRTAGVRGDGTDDGPALQAAVDKHRVLYFPRGNYRLSAPLILRPDSVLIGLHSATTILSFAGSSDRTRGVIVGPKGGSPIVSGLGVAPGNPRAAGILWMAGSKSFMDDVSFGFRSGSGFGGRGGSVEPATAGPAPATGPAVAPTAATPTVAPDLLVTDGGGGIFRNMWARATASGVGLRAENTSTPTRIYQLSNEHHMRVEVQFNNVRNWEIYCLQTEEENPAGADAIAVDVQDCRNLLFANTYLYRVSRNVRPKTYAIQVRNSDGIVFDNIKTFSQTRLAFDDSVFDETSGVSVRARDFTHFAVTRSLKEPAPLPLPGVFAKDAKVEQLATGFSNATSLTADGTGRVYFTDAAEHRIYRWNETSGKAEAIAELPRSLQPMVMSYVKPSTLLIMAYERYVYSLDLKDGAQPQQVSETATPLPGTVLLLPVGLHNSMAIMKDMMEHRGYVYRRGSNTAIIRAVEDERRGYYYAPGTNTAIMAGGTYRPILQSCQMAPFAPGDSHYLTSEDDARTWIATLGQDGKLTTRLFADRGGNSVVADSAGNVYLASGQVYIYDKQGRQIGILETPQRPTGLAFGGPDRKTLFIAARSSLYAIRALVAGE